MEIHSASNSGKTADSATDGDRLSVRRSHVVRGLLLTSVLFVASMLVGGSGAFGASSDGVMFGAWAQPRGNQTTTQAVQALENQLGDELPLVRNFARWNHNLNNSFNNWVVDGDRTLMLSIKPQRSNGQQVNWRSIANAQPGSQIHNEMVKLAQDAKKLDGDLWLSFHHEPEASTRTSYGDSDDFIAAWRKFHTVFEQQGVDAEWVWTMTSWSFEVNTSDRRSAGNWYPGDAYVDYLGADPYNWNQCRGNNAEQWQSLERVTTPFVEWANKNAPSKSLVLPEFGSDEGSSGRKAEWLDDAAAWLKRPEIASKFEAVIYFHDTQEGASGCTWWLDSSTQTLNAARRIANDSFFDSAGSGARTSAPAPTPTTTAAPAPTTTAAPAPTPAAAPAAAPPATSSGNVEIKSGLTSNAVFNGGCTVETINGSDRVSWTSQGSNAEYNVRRNGNWIRSTDSNTSFTNNGVNSGTYLIVARYGGNVAAGVCSRDGGTASQSASATNGLTPFTASGGCGLRLIDGDREITWTRQGGDFSYEVFRNGSSIATTSNAWYWNRGVAGGNYTVVASNNTSTTTMTCNPK